MQPVAQFGGLFEFQVARGLDHQFFKRLQLALHVLLRHRLVLGLRLRGALFLLGLVRIVDALDQVLDALLHADGRDAHLEIPGHLLGPPAIGFVDSQPHRIGHLVAIQDGHAVDVARCATDGLDERALGAQEAFLVGIEDGYERHFGNVEAFAQQVDADQHVELAKPQVADDFHALDGVDVGVQVPHAHAVLGEVVGEILGHALGERRDQHTFGPVDT